MFLCCQRLLLAAERPQAIGVIGGGFRPDVVACQIDVIPAERREPTQPLVVDERAPPPLIGDGAIEIAAIEQANACRGQIERRCSV